MYSSTFISGLRLFANRGCLHPLRTLIFEQDNNLICWNEDMQNQLEGAFRSYESEFVNLTIFIDDIIRGKKLTSLADKFSSN